MIGIGGLISGGIFAVIGVISVFTGPYSYISYLVTGIVALITVYSYHKLTSKWCDPGGEYTIIQKAFSHSKLKILGPFIGLLLFFGYIATMALYAYTFSVYIILLLGVEYNILLISIIVIVLFSVIIMINLKGVKESARFQDIIVVIDIVILIIFIIFGVLYTMQDSSDMIKNVGLDNESLSNLNFVGIILGCAFIMVSYQGFQLIAYSSHEMDDKEEGLKMMKWSLVISMTIYCLIGFTIMAILGVSGLIGDGSHDAEVSVAIAAVSFLGTFGLILIMIGVILATVSAINGTMLGSSRLAYRMSKDEVIPNRFSNISKNKVPYFSIIFLGVSSLLLTMVIGGALALAGVAGLIFAQVFFIINFTNFMARKETNSNAIIPIIGMTLTATFFTILIVYSIMNIEKEMFVLISFTIMESATLFFVLHINRKNQKSNQP